MKVVWKTYAVGHNLRIRRNDLIRCQPCRNCSHGMSFDDSTCIQNKQKACMIGVLLYGIINNPLIYISALQWDQLTNTEVAQYEKLAMN